MWKVLLLSASTFGALLLAAPTVLAHSAGIAALGCDGCHSGGKSPEVRLTAEPSNPAVGEPITLTISVSQTNGSTAGFYLTTTNPVPGAFRVDDSGTVASASAVAHSAPRIGMGATTTFKTQWTATTATGVKFDVYALSANGDRTNRGDGAGTASLPLLVGCSGATYYIDQDGDGYGSLDPAYPPRQECELPAGYAAATGDCDDFHADVHPSAVEQCDLKDNDCNGVVDDDVVIQPYCADNDGDGHGVPEGATKMDCKPSVGFGDCAGDCDDRDPNTHPGAKEACDGRDNNCDGKLDEGAKPTCGVGLCARYVERCNSVCSPGEPFAEICDGFDEDCDGVIDNGTNQALCGDPGLSCLLGRCTGTGALGGAAAGAGAGAGAGTGGGAASSGGPPARPVASRSGACNVGGLAGGHGAELSATATLLLLLRLTRRRALGNRRGDLERS